VHLTTGDSQLGRAEPIEDSAKVISRMTDIVMIRTFEQTKIERFAANSRVPVINGLTNEFHPCQILADLFTLLEHRGTDASGQIDPSYLRGKTVATELVGFTKRYFAQRGVKPKDRKAKDRKAKLDAAAAAVILHDLLESRRSARIPAERWD